MKKINELVFSGQQQQQQQQTKQFSKILICIQDLKKKSHCHAFPQGSYKQSIMLEQDKNRTIIFSPSSPEV